jgi:phosphoesterase RecJ-like protein
VSRKNYEQVKEFISSHSIKTTIIDHHEFDGKEETDVFINTKRPACAEEIYVLCFEQLKLKKPEGFAQTTLLGIVSDTQRHKFDHPGYHETYRISADLLDAGASIEKLENQLDRFNKSEVEVIAHLLNNMKSENGYTYSFINDEFSSKWQKANKPDTDLKNAADYFVNTFIRNFEGNKWGFLIYPDKMSGPGWWGVSLRSLSGAVDVSAIARQLGGGGHKPAAGAKVQASSLDDVIQTVKEVIANTL